MGKKMRKICFNNNSVQYLAEVSNTGGGVSPDVQLVKDDAVDGPFTLDELKYIGGLKRQTDNTIIIDKAAYDTQQAFLQKQKDDLQKMKDDIRSIPLSIGLPDLLKKLDALIKYLGI
jgi:hypothetical protein